MGGDEELKMFDAMLLKRELMRNCSIDVEILETFKDGLVLRIEEMVDMTSLAVVRDFVGKHQLNMLFENDVCFISNQILAPLEVTYLSE
jgi:hypothetical protein